MILRCILKSLGSAFWLTSKWSVVLFREDVDVRHGNT